MSRRGKALAPLERACLKTAGGNLAGTGLKEYPREDEGEHHGERRSCEHAREGETKRAVGGDEDGQRDERGEGVGVSQRAAPAHHGAAKTAGSAGADKGRL